MGELIDGVERREIDDRRAHFHRAIIGREIMRDIGQEDADPVALLDAEFLQAPRDTVHTQPDIRIAEFPPHKVGEIGIGMRGRAVSKHLRHGQRRIGLIPCRRVPIILAPDVRNFYHDGPIARPTGKSSY